MKSIGARANSAQTIMTMSRAAEMDFFTIEL
jgi:hypothetical protein